MSERVFVEHEEADAFAKALLAAHGVPKKDAATVAACLVGADLRGVETHGLTRLPGYLDRLRRGLINPKPKLFRNGSRHGGRRSTARTASDS